MAIVFLVGFSKLGSALFFSITCRFIQYISSADFTLHYVDLDDTLYTLDNHGIDYTCRSYRWRFVV